MTDGNGAWHVSQSATVTGRLRNPSGQGVAGQVVALERQVGAGMRIVARHRTAPSGAVRFNVKPRHRTDYRLSFGGSPQLTASSTGSVSVRVARRHGRRRH